MPIPIWLLEFREDNGRDPVPSELTEARRLQLNRCIRESRNAYPSSVIKSLEAIVGLRNAGPSEDPDPDKVFESLRIELVHYSPMLAAHFQWLRENEPEKLNQKVRKIQGEIKDIMGIPSKPAGKNPKSMQAAQTVLDGLIETAIVRRGEINARDQGVSD